MKKASKNWKGLHNDNYQSHSLLWSGADGVDCGRCFVLDYVDGERRMKPSQEQVLQWAREAGFGDEVWSCADSFIRLSELAYEAGRKDEKAAYVGLLRQLIDADLLASDPKPFKRREQ